jgi:hypothetical protein
MIEER